jgi:hypothetical protein
LKVEEQISRCNKAMLNDFGGMSTEEMMECVAILEGPLKLLEEEAKLKEAAEAEAKRVAAAEAKSRKELEAKREAELRAAKKKAHEELVLRESMKAKEMTLVQEALTSCENKIQTSLVETQAVEECNVKLGLIEANSVTVHPRIKPFFGSRNVEVVLAPLLVVFGVVFWLFGCLFERQSVVPMVNPTAGSSGVSISEIIIRPGNEVCIIKNRTGTDVVRIDMQVVLCASFTGNFMF